MYPKKSTSGDAKKVVSSPNFPAIEKDVLKFWRENGIFKKSIDQNKSGQSGSNEYVFYDGPPFANGLPHYGHLLTGYVKDVIPRFQTMLSKRVERRFGWDTHGLPAELEAQRELGIDDVNEIYELGIGKFNDACRKSVLKYVDEWQDYVEKQARWVDFENDYKTLDIDYMESVLWAFKQLYDKDLAYKGYKVLPYCWHDQTPLSNHELRMDDDVYKERQDNTVTVAMKVTAQSFQKSLLNEYKEIDFDNLYLCVWTTTPWTLPTNFAVAVGGEIEYTIAKVNASEGDNAYSGKSFIIASSCLEKYSDELGLTPEIVTTIKGSSLNGLRYFPIFDYFPTTYATVDVDLKNAYQVRTADYVGEGEGTGLVHIAPYGEDDMVVLAELGVKPPVPMDAGAILTEPISDYTGLHVFDSNREIVRDLREGTGSQARINPDVRAILLRTQSVAHSYPHCWRCRNPLIYRPISSWFVNVVKIKKRMLELNDAIRWIPENVQHGQFGKWLEGARDWSISRNRFWGAPIPVWVSSDPAYPRVDVYGSINEMEEAFADCLKNDLDAKSAYPDGRITDLHRPQIDTLWRYNPDDPSGESKMIRIADVFDCWFESGSMPFASVHYPFENKTWFEEHYPSDFIVEYIGQTRGWFYTLHIMATALFDCNAFKNVMCHGVVLGDDGQKMSKSLRNYPDVSNVFEDFGSDAMRWFLMSSNILRGGNLSVTKEAIHDTVRGVLLPLWSTYYFFTMYANAANGGEGYDAKRLEPRDFPKLDVQDRYILAKERNLVESLHTSLQNFDIAKACFDVREFLDVLTNWYIRTNRTRFWKEDPKAFDTLWTVLEFLMRALAPLLPLTTEEVWQGLTDGESVHLQTYPVPYLDRNADETLVEDSDLVKTIDDVREAVSSVSALRKNANMRVRQPLASMRLAVKNPARFEEFVGVILSETNVKQLDLLDADLVEMSEYGIEQQLSPNARALGPRIGKRVQDVIKAAKSGEWTLSGSTPIVQLKDGPFSLEEGEYTLTNVVDSELAGEQSADILAGGFVVLNLELNQDLIDEGIARDLIREVQEARKQAGLEVSDRINLSISDTPERISAAKAFTGLIEGEVLAKSVQLEEGAPHIKVESVI
ncbi:MAG: isoleucine--tRNA ligase [Candidatus Ancillula sp.]|jgi:isoleucyl-tRNA synthetase|nr:isoleucine--tRNA ligase [Candidatus Ancillula sp.]